ETVLAARTRDHAIVGAVVLPVAIAQISQLPLTLLPVDAAVLLLGEAARVADPFGIEVDRQLAARRRVFVLHGGVRPLVGDHAAPAEPHFHGQAIPGRLGPILAERYEVDVTMT